MEEIYSAKDYKKALERFQLIADARKGTDEHQEAIELTERLKEYEESRFDWNINFFNEQ